MKRIGSTQQKIILLLLAGVSIGLTRSFKRQLRIAKELKAEWAGIDRAQMNRSINALRAASVVDVKRGHREDTLLLTGEGKKRARELRLHRMKIQTPKRWDGKFRLVMFDIPHRIKPLRESLRRLCIRLGFYPLQKSVFVYPYDCQKEIEAVIAWYHAESYVHFAIVQSIDNELQLKKHFKLS